MTSTGNPRRAAARATSTTLAGLALVTGGMACATGVPDYTPDSDEGSRHAVISVERSSTIGSEEPSAAEAFAQFAQVPASDEPGRVLRATGMLRDLPAAGECAALDGDDFSGPLGGIGRVELLEVGQVAIEVDGTVTSLGAHAFPTVSDFISGVVYASRDRDAEALPADASYGVRIGGSAAVPAMAFEFDAPGALTNVTLGGLPLEEVTRAPSTAPIDLTWSVGDASDLVYAELLPHDESTSVVCTFQDVEGVGTIPADLLPSGEARLSLHRLRTTEIEDPSLDSGELRFDVELSTYLELE